MARIITKVYADLIRVYDTVTREAYELNGTEWSAKLTASSLIIDSHGKQIGGIYTDQSLNLGNSVFGYTSPAAVPAFLYNQNPGTSTSSGGGGLNAAQVVDLIVPGVGLTETVDPVTGRKTLNNNVTPVALPVVQYASIFGDLATLPFQEGLVFCSQYWPGAANTGGKGGTFKAIAGTTLAVDNVRIFAGSGCRWVRQGSNSTTLEDAGCINRGGTNTGEYKLFQNPQTNFAAMPLLSDKFSNLAAAQSWYPGARLNNPAKVERGVAAGFTPAQLEVTAFTTSLNNAALQHALTLYPIEAEKGVFRFNRPIELFTGAELRGKGGYSSQTVFVFESDNGFVGRRSSALAATNPQDEIYKFGIKLSGIRYIGTLPIPNNSNEQPDVLNTSSFSDSKCGFQTEYQNPDPNLPEALDATPLWNECDFEDLAGDRWYGHGFSSRHDFTCRYNRINCNNNKGFGYHSFLGNSSKSSNHYPGRFNSAGTYWMENGGIADNWNGCDHFDNVRPQIVMGKPTVDSYKVAVTMLYGNMEGFGKHGILLCGLYSTLNIEQTFIQWWSDNVNDSPILLKGFGCKVRLNPGRFSYCGNSPNKLKPVNIITALSNQTTVEVISDLSFAGADHEMLVVNDLNTLASPYTGYPQKLLRRAVEGWVNSATYGLIVVKQKPTLAERLWVGDGTATREFKVESTVQNLNATGSVTSWDRIVTIGNAPLTSNIVITLPTITGKRGQSVRFCRVDSAAFTVTFAFAEATQSFVVAPGTQLNTQGGTILLTPISATKVLVSD